MNIVLWVVQVAIAFLCISGGAYKIFKFDDLAKMPAIKVLPRAGWAVIGASEIVAGPLLVVPLAIGWMPELTPMAAAFLAVENLALSANYARFSTKMIAANPLVWTLATGLMAAFVSYGRFAA